VERQEQQESGDAEVDEGKENELPGFDIEPRGSLM
jgi:hypothetical protein